MTRRFEIEDAGGRRSAGAADFPLAIGGTEGDLRLPQLDVTVAWLGLDAGDLFVQPADGHRLRVAGAPIEISHWLQVGDEVDLGAGRLHLESGQRGPRLRLSAPAADEATAAAQPPRLVPPPRPVDGTTEAPAQGPAAGRPIDPVIFHPAISTAAVARPGGRRLVAGGLILILVTALAAIALFLFTARSVRLEITPAPDRFEIEGGLLTPEIGDRRLMRPGAYAVVAEKAGYQPLRTVLHVGPEARQSYSFELRRLPGRLALTALSAAGLPAIATEAPPKDAEGFPEAPDGFEGEFEGELEGELEAPPEPFDADREAQVEGALAAEIEIDGELVASTPAELELEPGQYRLRLSAERHRPFETTVQIEGAGTAQRIDVVLEPRWADVSFTSRPAGARLRVDGEDLGTTPATAELLEGVRQYRLSKAGFSPRSGAIEVVAGAPQELGPIVLRPSGANLSITSRPSGATVTVAGTYRGETPLELSLAPGARYRVRVAKRGFDEAERQLRLDAGAAQDVHFELEAQLGAIVMTVFPPDAELRIDGEQVAERRLRLPATVAHRIDVTRDGYLPFSTEIVPLAGHEQSLEVRLEARGAARERAIRELTETTEGQLLRLVEPGRFRMGASRREPGRRANETLREVELSRRFYLSAHEVSNAQFRRFRPDHRSGLAGEHSLELDAHPVVQVSWQDAAAYCNWLSAQEGLEPAYVTVDGKLVAASRDRGPVGGYRLPTEAEWAWAARYPGGAATTATKYSWGDALPVAEGAGNFADRAAADLLPATLADYHDGFPATAPVDSFAADARGIFQLAGNVAEWVHDVYVVRPALVGAVERDPMGPPSGDLHVIRGSGWMHSTITELRLSFRDYGDKPRPDVGFRIARPIP